MRARARVHVREVSVSLVVPEMFTRVIPVEKKLADDASVRRRIKRKREGSVEEHNKRTQAVEMIYSSLNFQFQP